MQINLKGDIVILDEAHNIEDICRDAASVNLIDDKLAIAAYDCKNIWCKCRDRDQDIYYENVSCKCRNRDRDIYITIQTYLTDIVKFLGTLDVKQNVSVYIC